MKDKKGRAALNERFKYAFKILEERGEIIRNDHSKGFSAVAETIFNNRAYGHLINKFLNDERYIKFEQAERFCEGYNVSLDFIFKGEGKAFVPKKTEQNNGYRAPQENVHSTVLYSNVAALASSALGIDMYESAETFSIPGLKGGEYIAFSISGSSMSPTLEEDDIVICRPLEGVEKIKDNEVYAVVSDNGVQVKRVQKIYSRTGKLIRLKMISDNYLEHDPFLMTIGEVRQILKVDRKLTAL